MIIGAVKESFPHERRVALIPAAVRALAKAGLEVLIESGAGGPAGFPDEVYTEKGAGVLPSRAEVFEKAGVILQVRSFGANPEAGRADLDLMRAEQAVIGFSDPLGAPEAARETAARGVTAFSMEMMPRITRAQSMDALSSMATVAGYRAVLLAAESLPRMFPMLMTAAGTLSPAHVFVIGAGVAGLQAIATARRLGARVKAYDVRPAVKEQVESVGAKFVELELETGGAEDAGGYAKAQDEAFYRKQREMMSSVCAKSDVVITTAAIPGRKAPVLITGDMVSRMAPGSVIVDLAAERGGNCELTKADGKIVEQDVTIIGHTNLPSEVPFHASQMYAKNISTFLLHLVKEGGLNIDMEDEITRETLICRGGKVVHEQVMAALGSGQAKDETERDG
jgi:NAD(P) transhydrogenase subunit alpha